MRSIAFAAITTCHCFGSYGDADGRTLKEAAIFPILQLGPFRFYTFGLLFGAAVLLGTWLFLRYFQRHRIAVNPPVLAATLIGSGFVGAKLDNALVIGRHFLHREVFGADFFQSGYTYLGCVLGGVLAGMLYIRIHRLPWLRTLDSLYCIAPAYALGRVGCFLAGDGDYGTASNLPWAVAFPHGVAPTLVRVHPTMLYSAAWEMCVFLLLSRLDRKQARPGTLFGLYLLCTSIGRFSVEFLGRNPALAFHLTEAQLVSLVLGLAGALVLLPAVRTPVRRNACETPSMLHAVSTFSFALLSQACQEKHDAHVGTVVNL